MPGYQFRAVAFTWHKVENPPVLGKLTYLAYAEETCPTTGKKHYQGFAYRETKQTHAAWRKALPGAHIEEMHGNFRQNEKYCSKEGKLIEFGVKPMENGKKRKLIEIKERIDEGEKPVDIAEEERYFPIWVNNHRALEVYNQHKRAKRLVNDRSLPEVHLRIGPPGTGKTRWCDDQFGPDGWKFAPDNTGRWFDGCDCDVIVFDDVERGQVPPLSTWKKLTDRYGGPMPTKGGFVYWKPKVIVVTSNSHPRQWWPDASEFDIGAVERRLTSVTVVEDYINDPPVHSEYASLLKKKNESKEVPPVEEQDASCRTPDAGQAAETDGEEDSESPDQ